MIGWDGVAGAGAVLRSQGPCEAWNGTVVAVQMFGILWMKTGLCAFFLLFGAVSFMLHLCDGNASSFDHSRVYYICFVHLAVILVSSKAATLSRCDTSVKNVDLTDSVNRLLLKVCPIWQMNRTYSSAFAHNAHGANKELLQLLTV